MHSPRLELKNYQQPEQLAFTTFLTCWFSTCTFALLSNALLNQKLLENPLRMVAPF